MADDSLSISSLDDDLTMARIMALATVVLENETHAREWRQRPLKVLDGKSPLELMSTKAGAREVEHVLGRLEHGVFS